MATILEAALRSLHGSGKACIWLVEIIHSVHCVRKNISEEPSLILLTSYPCKSCLYKNTILSHW